MRKNLSPEELLKRFASVNNLTEDEAKEKVGAETSEEILDNIAKYTREKIEAQVPTMNRKQRRAWFKKFGKKNQQIEEQTQAIADTTEKLNYIDLIQKLRTLNEKIEKENEENVEATTENN